MSPVDEYISIIVNNKHTNPYLITDQQQYNLDRATYLLWSATPEDRLLMDKARNIIYSSN